MANGPADPQQGDSVPDNGSDHFLRRLTLAVIDRPAFSLVCLLATALLCVGVTVLWIEFRTSRADLINPSAEFHQRWTKYTKAFGDASDLVVVFEADDDPDAIKRAQEDLGDRLRAETEFFSHVLFRVESGHLRRKGLQYLSPAQLESGLNRLHEFRPLLTGESRLSLEALSTGLLLQLQRPSDGETETQIQKRNASRQLAVLVRSLEGFLRNSQFRSPWPQLMSVSKEQRGAGDQVVYLMNETGTVGFLKAKPVQQGGFDGATASIKRMRELISDVSTRHRSVRIGLTGIPVLENDEMRRSQSDMVTASLVSFLGVGVLLLAGFRGLRHPLLALVMLATAMCWTFGYTTLAIGHLNILSVSFAAILIGLGIDFGIHYLAKYLELRHRSLPLREALAESSSTVGVGILTAAATTSLAFCCAAFTDFLGVAELGLIAGGGIIEFGLCDDVVDAVSLFAADAAAAVSPLVAWAQGPGLPTQLAAAAGVRRESPALGAGAQVSCRTSGDDT